MFCIRINPESGLTVIELLIITSVLAIITVFGTPILSNALSPSEFQRGIDICETSVKQARQTARFYHTDVLMKVGYDETQNQQTITLLIPRMQRTPTMNEVTVEFVLPAGVEVTSQEHVIHFMPNGEVEPPSETLNIFNQIEGESHQLALVE
jgi:Tfp pilus assembly protein FimT